MNISTSIINMDLLRARNIRYNLLFIYAEALFKGNISLIHSIARDVSMLYILESALTNCIIFKRDDNFVNDASFKIREYMNAINIGHYVDYYNDTYLCTLCPNYESILPGVNTTNIYNSNTNTNVTNIYEVNYSSDWLSQVLTVIEEGQTVIPGLTIDLATADMDTIILEVQGDNPAYTTSGNGYHIANKILYWHDAYRLRPNMQIKLRWKLA